jgi:hypothetical protein
VNLSVFFAPLPFHDLIFRHVLDCESTGTTVVKVSGAKGYSVACLLALSLLLEHEEKAVKEKTM